ncbi:type IV secretory system conjugative DNA transfer family protein [Xanthomonas albilineans]|uniref:type IV secretory system conjugative DNA transfer family protein n=1 Tax=Xanthomonas albilineans TaxID=29447 RepID=UPI0005F334BC|nr:type IV secretory system conjugative DNA transfer family protein [Xanthomonas albilineans]
MNSRTKGITAVIALLPVAIAGLYLSGFLVLTLLGEHAQVQLLTYWRYWQVVDQPAWHPYAPKIKLAGICGFGLPVMLYLIMVYAMLRTKAQELYGNARWARRDDLSRHDVLKDDPRGLIACRFGRRFIRIQSKHLLLAASTRGGKGVSVVIPNLLAWLESAVILDVKREAWEKTAGQRAKYGQVYMFDPFSDDGSTDRWNPLGYVRLDPNHRNGDIVAIASTLYKEMRGENPFWPAMGRKTFVAACECLFDDYASKKGTAFETGLPTLGGVYRLLAGAHLKPGQSMQHYLGELLRQPTLGTHARTGLNNLVGLAPETFTSAIETALAPLNIFSNPIVDAATSANDFDLSKLRKTVQSIYVGVSPAKLIEAKGVLNLFFEQAIKLNGRELPEHNPELKYQCMFMLDEFTALGRVEIVPVAVGWVAGYGIRIVIVIQSIAQLESVYGADTARGLITNLGVRIVFTPREQRDAEEYSKMLGETTVRRRQRTQSYGPGNSHSYTEVLDRRPLMNPDEVKGLAPDKAIVFIEGIGYPILANKIFYYKDSYFKKLLLKAPQVPRLALGGA